MPGTCWARPATQLRDAHGGELVIARCERARTLRGLCNGWAAAVAKTYAGIVRSCGRALYSRSGRLSRGEGCTKRSTNLVRQVVGEKL